MRNDLFRNNSYSRCHKFLCTKVSDKMTDANSVDADQTAPGGSSLIRDFRLIIFYCILNKGIGHKL